MDNKDQSLVIRRGWYELAPLYSRFMSGSPISLSEGSLSLIEESYHYLRDKALKDSDAYYGINTGFGSLCDVKIRVDELEELQYNLLRSHACGTGDTVPREIVRMMLLLKVMSLSQGYSGVSAELINRLIHFYNNNIVPVIYEYGSLGASGDLAPLAHLALPLIGEGEVWKENSITKTEETDIGAIELGPKSGLALINGTQFSTAYTYCSVMEGKRLLEWAVMISAISCDAFGCLRTPFDDRIHRIRQQKGQRLIASRILELLSDSELTSISGSSVQDPYSFRCTPQVLGASWDALMYAWEIVEREVNAVTDNPNIFSDSDGILTGGNFHAQPIAIVADYLAIALAEVASISERRLYQLLSGNRDLPDYLIDDAGYQSGMMIVQYSAASVVSHNKQLCTPSVVDSIVSSQGQEDHVSMAANAAVKLYKVVGNLRRVLAMELIAASQAIDFRKPLKPNERLQHLHASFRERVPFLDKDREMHVDIRRAIDFISENAPDIDLGQPDIQG